MKFNHPIFKTPIAHRGLHNEFDDENSLGAFKNAVKEGYGIELDVHLMKDGNLVVVHDVNLKRVTGIDQDVTSLTKDELKNYPLLKSKTPPPLLKDVLKMVDGKVPLMIELKIENEFNEEFPKVLLELLASYPHKESVALQSFNPYAMKWLRLNQTYPYILGQLASDELPGQSKLVLFMFRHLFVLNVSKPDFLNQDVLYIKKRKIARLRRKMGVIAWTIDSKEKLKTAEKYADNIVFEHLNLKERKNVNET